MAFLHELFQKNFSTFLTMSLLLAVPLLGSAAVLGLLAERPTLLQHLNLAQSLLYFALAGLTMALALTPTTFVAIISGYYFGWAGLPGMVAAYALAAALGYELARRLDHGKLRAVLHHFPKAEAVLAELQSQSWSLIILTRLSPVLPFALMTFVLAIVGVARQRFLAASVLGMLPRSLFFYWLGTKAPAVLALLHDPDEGTASKLVLIGLVVASLFGLYVVFDRALQRVLRRGAAR
ncbi:TVP38/TMEM64 family protein [Hymenobacter psoromatis]|uniref:TVP38/TMEM64 family protein n=1 Tax=Hymenobacter psoromatis TaxID=1484116 RepID=UPI001CC0713F|nr:VTT domain-containing protein [Hymenobacter psoromatis]